jgi:hypothetical protein
MGRFFNTIVASGLSEEFFRRPLALDKLRITADNTRIPFASIAAMVLLWISIPFGQDRVLIFSRKG